MRSFTIPSIFTAIDKISGPVKAMGRNVEAFANKAEVAIARGERTFRKLTPALSSAAKEFLAFASTAAIAAGIISTIHFSFQSLKDYEDALASFRTIVSDLSDKEFAKYQDQINMVARDTKKSSIDVAASFEKIAGLNADFAKTSEGIGAVSKAAIVLSKASRDDLGTSAENLVGIMNQFGMGALEADRAINVLAAGQAVGAASITQTAESFKNFGSVASGANISLEESVGLIQTLGKFSVFGAEAGTKLRGSVLKLQQAGVGYASGQFNINDALLEASNRINKLRTEKEKDAALNKMFGAENIATGRILLSNIETYKQYTAGVTGTSEAHKAAEINSQSLSVRLDQLKNKWINILTSSESTGNAMSILNKVLVFVTDNMETLLAVGVGVLGFFAAWKALLIGGKVAMAAYNIVYGINNALQKKSLFYTEGNIYAKKADLVMTKLMTANQWLLNAAMSANPIGIIIIAIVALVAIIAVAIKHYNQWGAALLMLMGPMGWLINLIQSFRRNWDMIVSAFKEGGILAGLKAIGKTLIDAMLMPLQQILEIASKIPGLGWAGNLAAKVGEMREGLGVNTNTDESGNPLLEKQAINTEAGKQEALTQRLESTNNAKVDLNVNDPNNRVKATSNSPLVTIRTGSTMPVGGTY